MVVKGKWSNPPEVLSNAWSFTRLKHLHSLMKNSDLNWAERFAKGFLNYFYENPNLILLTN